MAFVRTAMKAGIAKKIWNEVRKPQNQDRAKALLRKANARRSGRSGGSTKAAPDRPRP